MQLSPLDKNVILNEKKDHAIELKPVGKVERIVNSFWHGLSLLKQKVLPSSVTNRVKKVVGLTGKAMLLAGKVSVQGIICFDEAFDFADFGGTKDPLTSINKNRSRLSYHDQNFAQCLEFLADQAASYYTQNSENIRNQVVELIKDYPSSQLDEIKDKDFSIKKPNFGFRLQSFFFDIVAGGVDWLMDISKELIGQTIKANILHIAANLADEAFDSTHLFADRQRNPFGRLLSVIGITLGNYKERLSEIEQLLEEEKTEHYHEIFKEISEKLLAKIFPRGAEDIQLFHHTFPGIKIIKKFLWKKIEEALPLWLERLYHETRPLSVEIPNWQEQFNTKADGLEAGQMVQLPSKLFESFVRSNRAKALDAQLPAIENWLKEKGVKDPEMQSERLVKYIKEFVLTDDSSLHKMGAFFERYFMEHILYQLSQFVPQEGEDSSLLFYILKRWTQGEVFKSLRYCLSGKSLTSENKVVAIRELLAPFGLHCKETFPLPPCIKEKVWPKIEQFQEQELFDFTFSSIPKWMMLNKRKSNRAKLDLWLKDSSLTKSVSHVADTLVNLGVHQLEKAQLSIGQKLNELLPSLALSQDRQENLDKQWDHFLKDQGSIQILKIFGKKSLEALTLQLCKDLYKNYQEECSYKNLPKLFEEGDHENEREFDLPLFPAWLMLEIVKACKALAIETLTDQELKDFQKAIRLKNALQNTSDSLQAKKGRQELDKLWSTIQPKFDHLTRHLLLIFGYAKEGDLPFPKQLQSGIWELIIGHLPLILFEQMSDLMLPLLEKEELKGQIGKLSQGDFIQRGCKLLAQDIVEHIPEWVGDKIEKLPKKLAETQSNIDLTNKTQHLLVDTLNSILNVEDPAYEPLWKWLESYLEALFLKISLEISQKNEVEFESIQTLMKKTREDLLVLEGGLKEEGNVGEGSNQKVQIILNKFTDDLFAWLNIQKQQDLFGIPQALQGPLLKGIKEKIACGLLGVYHLENKIRHHEIKVNPVDEQLPTSEIARTLLVLTRYALDSVTDKLAERDLKGNVKIISQLYDPLNIWLSKHKKDYAIAELFQQVIVQQVPTPFLINLFDRLDARSTQSYKNQIGSWINPVLTDQVIKYLVPLLEKEQQGQAAFDQVFLMALLPVVTHHLKHINQASHMIGGLNIDNFLDVAEQDLHPAVPLFGNPEEKNLQRQEKFYKKQTEIIFELLFPNGKEDLKIMLSDIKLTEEQLMTVLESAQELVATQLPKVLEFIFDKEILVEVMNNLFKSIIESLDEPIEIKSMKKVSPLTKEEKERQSEMDQLVGELVIEAARFMDLPVDFLERLPEWAKRMTRLNHIEKSIFESLGAAIREKFNGELLVKSIQSALPKLVEKQYIKRNAEEKSAEKNQEKQHLQELEKKLAQRTIVYIFRYLGARLENATNIFTNSVIKLLREVIVAVSSFVIVRLIGGTLHFLKIDQLIVNLLHKMIQYRTQKIVHVFSQQDLNENLVFHGVESFEDVLTS